MSWTLYDMLLRQTEPLCTVETLDGVSATAAAILKTRNTKLKAICGDCRLNVAFDPWWPKDVATTIYFDGTGQ